MRVRERVDNAGFGETGQGCAWSMVRLGRFGEAWLGLEFGSRCMIYFIGVGTRGRIRSRGSPFPLSLHPLLPSSPLPSDIISS